MYYIWNMYWYSTRYVFTSRYQSTRNYRHFAFVKIIKKSLDSYTLSFVALGVMKGNQIKNGLWKNAVVFFNGFQATVKGMKDNKFLLQFPNKQIWVNNKLIVWN